MTIPAWHRDYVGIPFLEHGRDASGCDCWGLYRLILLERAGVALPSYGTVYGTTRDGNEVAGAIRVGIEEEDWTEVPEGSERLFDAALMTGYSNDPATGGMRAVEMHVGAALAPGALIHVERGVDAALGFYKTDLRLKRRMRAFFRHRELADA